MSNLTNYRRQSALTGLWHDYANLFPMLGADGQDALRADIQQHGVREPVILFDGRILDGRNRYMAARDLGVDFPVVDFDGTDAEALAYVLSTNLHRRHLTESQRAAVAAKLANMRRGNPDFSKPANLPNSACEVSQAQAADMLNVSERSVRTAKTVIEQGAPELVAAVESGAVSVSAAATVSELPKDEQAATVAEGPGAVKAKAKAIREKKATSDPRHQDEDPETAKARKALAGLTREGLEDEVIGLRANLADSKAEARQAKAEIAELKEKLRDFDGDSADVIRRLQKAADYERSKAWKATEEQGRLQKQIYALKKRVSELEGMEIPL